MFNNNRFDYIVSRSVIVEDNTGRPVTKRMYINQDYANIYGIELGNQTRLGKHLRGFFSVAYQVARGKSNSARESGLQIEQNGEVSLTTENYLAWDRPWDINFGMLFKPDTTFSIAGKSFNGFRTFLNYSYTSGFRYTPYSYVGENELGRPLYEIQNDQYLEGIAEPWINLDLKFSQDLFFNKKKGQGLTFTFEIRNVMNRQNSQIINPITGRAYEEGDDVTEQYRDPRYIGPEENGEVPDNPARYLAPRQLLYGIVFRF
jgi:outer membrane receptor protein involved in Fe transport